MDYILYEIREKIIIIKIQHIKKIKKKKVNRETFGYIMNLNKKIGD